MRPTPLPPAAAALLPLLPLALAACAQAGPYGAVAVQQRRIMNDLQARAAMAATCDISLGAYFRELSEIERRFAGLVCGGVLPPDAAGTGAPPPPAGPPVSEPGAPPPSEAGDDDDRPAAAPVTP